MIKGIGRDYRTRKAMQIITSILCALMFLTMSTDGQADRGELFVVHDPKTDLYGFKDKQGRMVILPQFEHVMVPSEAALFSSKNKEFFVLVPVVKKGKIWRMTREGLLKFETVFFDNGPDYYEEGLSRFIKDGKVGFHDTKGQVVIPPLYDFASPFREGHANVCQGCYAHYPKMPTYPALSSSFCSSMREDMYKSVVGGKWGMIDRQGRVVIPLIHDSWEAMEAAHASQ
ncbi:hypothetical protein GQ61_06735 [Candidatus Nucleicultrix amoebiphila FS5]|jgi:hypothetical protein|uniref:WG repeat-containing protein n=2 Tax=Candidatus Nucleicultrix TaxID=1509243 RepID=A0A1W6N5B1_9PROT|nr:hypothetical protein GQ61_06735 [Candidatus Nucleicultrix amoebiphila FS5]